MEHPFFTTSGRRAILPEIIAHIEDQIHATPVSGLHAVVETGDSRYSDERASGYQESHNHKEWLLPLSAQTLRRTVRTW